MTDIECKEMNHITNRYQQNIDTNKAQICKIDPLPILYAAQSKLQDSKVDVCLCERNPVCRCVKGDCTCDSDAYVDIDSVKMDLGSNCTFICEFTSKRDKLLFLVPSKTNKSIKHSTIRIFTLNKKDNSEHVAMDIVRDASFAYVQLYDATSSKHLKYQFDIVDDVYVREYTLIVKLNYMSMVFT